MTELTRLANKQPILLADWQVPRLISRHNHVGAIDSSFSEDGLSVIEGLWTRSFVRGSTTYNHCEYALINPFIKGIRRDVVRVTVGGVEYTEANSVPTCDNTAGSWFFDPVTCHFYVRPALNLPFDKVFILDDSNGNWHDETEDARTSTTADIAIEGAVDDELYIGMKYSRHRFWRFTFSTAPVGGTRTWSFWDPNASAWVAFTSSIVAITGNVNLTATDNILHWTDPLSFVDPIGQINLWDRYDDVGDDTGAESIGKPNMFWVRIKNATGYSTAGVGTQFFVSPVLDESLVIAWLEIPLGNRSVHIDGKFYAGRLITQDQNMVNQISSKNSDAFQEAMIGTTVTGSGGELTISGGDGEFDEVVESNELLHGGRVPMRIGYNTPTYTMPIADYTHLRTPIVEGVRWGDNAIILAMMNQTLKMDVPVLQSFLTVADYRNMSPDKEGQPIPIYFGNTEVLAAVDDTPETKWARGLKGTIVKPGQPIAGGFVNQGWKFGTQVLNPETGTLHGYGTIAAVMMWKGNKPIDIAANKYTLKEGNTRVDFKNGFVAEGEIRIRTQGVRDDATGTFTGSANGIISKPSDVAHFLLVCICRYKTSELALATFTETGITKQGTAGALTINSAWKDGCSVYVGASNEKVRDVINLLMNQIDGALQPNNEGLLQISVRSDDISANDPVLFRHHTSDYEVTHDTKFMASNVVVKYRQFPATGERSTSSTAQFEIFQTTEGYDVFVADNYAESYLGLNNLVSFDTYMFTPEKVEALRSRFQQRFRKGRRIYTLKDIYGITISNLLGGNVLLNRSRSLGGELKERQTWLLTCKREQGKHLVSIEAMEAAS